MKGSLVRWMHDDEPTNLCVILREYVEDDNYDDADEHLRHVESPLFLIYDFVTNELFYAVLDELQFI
jgi:hypothetical protein